MRLLPLVRAYMWHHAFKTAVLFACLMLTLYLPIAFYGFNQHVQSSLLERARETPLLIGLRGSQLDLVLHALYHRTEVPGTVPQSILEEIRKGALARTIPLYNAHTAKGYAIVATSLDYFSWRNLVVAEGGLPMRLGDCVLGAELAKKLHLQPGDSLLTDSREFFDLAGSYPLKLRITGILDASNPADDGVVFVDLNTAWLMDGLAHGHEALNQSAASEVVLEVRDGIYVGSPAVTEFTEVTMENIGSFHFHGDPALFPLTAVIAIPYDERSETLLLGRFVADDSLSMALRPLDVVRDLFARLLPLQKMFALQTGLLAIIVISLILLVVSLSLRLRKEEFETMESMGCCRSTIITLWLSELLLLLSTALFVAILAAIISVWIGGEWLRGMIG
jgi:putative ABC transport system permease protein